MSGKPAISPALAETLHRLGAAVDVLQDDWWLIGSAAMALNGARPLRVADVDLLVSVDDARRLGGLWGVRPAAPGPHDLFRSEVYFQWTEPPVPIDVMAGFEVKTPGGWRPVRPRSRLCVRYGEAAFHTPSVSEQIEILELFDRPKDRERAALLRSLRA